MGLDDKTFCPVVSWPSIPLWILETPNIDLEILERKLDGNLDLVYEYYSHIKEKYREHICIFTDGSKDPETSATGAAFVVQGWNVEIYKKDVKLSERIYSRTVCYTDGSTMDRADPIL